MASGKSPPAEIQRRFDAVPAGKYDAIVLGYGLCSNILAGLKAPATPLVIPRAHDCITFFLGSKERYREFFDAHPGTYYYTSGWIECAKRRGIKGSLWSGASMPAGAGANFKSCYEEWVEKYGEDQAKYLIEEMGRWTESYSHGTLINFDFAKPLKLDEQVRQICADRGWKFHEADGDLTLFQNLLDGQWGEADFLVVRPGQTVGASFDDSVIRAEPADGG